MQIDERYIRTLTRVERLRLLERTARDLAAEDMQRDSPRSIMELRGLGKEVWADIDPQRYVDELREEWSR